MALGLLGFKVGMTQVFAEDGSAEPVTVIEVGPCPVLQIRNKDTDGYEAVQIGFKDKSRKNARRSEQGHVASKLESKRKSARLKGGVQLPPKADCEPQRHTREFRMTAAPTVTVGQVLKVADIFKDVKAVDVVGTTKGRGYKVLCAGTTSTVCPPHTVPKRFTGKPVRRRRSPATGVAVVRNAVSSGPVSTAIPK